MFRARRLRAVRSRFLDACRSLSAGRSYFDRMPRWARALIQEMVPMPLLGLDQDGAPLLSALEWLEAEAKRRTLSEDVLRGYHRMIRPAGEGGEYRRGAMKVVGSRIARPPGDRVPTLMKALEADLDLKQKCFDAAPPPPEEVFRFAVEAHRRFVWIHPFPDGNGRVGRLALNHLLRRYGQGYVILPPIDRSPEHFEALEAAHQGDLDRLVTFARRHVHPA
jgi:prophage maintenance system killer protein